MCNGEPISKAQKSPERWPRASACSAVVMSPRVRAKGGLVRLCEGYAAPGRLMGAAGDQQQMPLAEVHCPSRRLLRQPAVAKALQAL